MSPQFPNLTFVSRPTDEALLDRIRAEYREMPGMRLTLTQAARLFDVEAAKCASLLSSLVDAGALSTTEGTFTLANAGRHQL